MHLPPKIVAEGEGEPELIVHTGGLAREQHHLLERTLVLGHVVVDVLS